jgi:hypothetical protein
MFKRPRIIKDMRARTVISLSDFLIVVIRRRIKIIRRDRINASLETR